MVKPNNILRKPRFADYNDEEEKEDTTQLNLNFISIPKNERYVSAATKTKTSWYPPPK